MMLITEFYDALDHHDFFFEFADDHRWWKSGRDRHDQLTRIAREGGDAYVALFRAFNEHHFSGKPWKTEKQPKPERPST